VTLFFVAGGLLIAMGGFLIWLMRRERKAGKVESVVDAAEDQTKSNKKLNEAELKIEKESARGKPKTIKEINDFFRRGGDT